MVKRCLVVAVVFGLLMCGPSWAKEKSGAPAKVKNAIQKMLDENYKGLQVVDVWETPIKGVYAAVLENEAFRKNLFMFSADAKYYFPYNVLLRSGDDENVVYVEAVKRGAKKLPKGADGSRLVERVNKKTVPYVDGKEPPKEIILYFDPLDVRSRKEIQRLKELGFKAYLQPMSWMGLPSTKAAVFLWSLWKEGKKKEFFRYLEVSNDDALKEMVEKSKKVNVDDPKYKDMLDEMGKVSFYISNLKVKEPPLLSIGNELFGGYMGGELLKLHLFPPKGK